MELSKGSKVFIILFGVILLLFSSFIVGMFLLDAKDQKQLTQKEQEIIDQQVQINLYCQKGRNLEGKEYEDWYYSVEGDLCAEAESESNIIDYQQYQIDKCQYQAYKSYYEQWLSYCEINKIKIVKESDGTKSCSVPVESASKFNDYLQKEKGLCISRYK